MSLPTALLDLAERQHGLFTREQARSFRVAPKTLQRMRRLGRLQQLTSTVLAVAGAPRTDHRHLMAATLHTGGMVSAFSAAALWDLPGYELVPAHVMTGRRTRGTPTSLAVVHTTRWILPAHHTTLHGIPVTTPTRTLFDLSGKIPIGRLERTLDTAWSRRLTTGPLLHGMLDELARRGRPRIRTMRALLENRGEGYLPPESGLEARFELIAREAGYRTLRRQVEVGDEQAWLGRVDFLDEVHPVVVQVDSDLHHRALVDERHDREQTAALERAGLVVLRVRQHDVWHDRAAIVAQLRDAYRLARARRGLESEVVRVPVM